MMRIASVFLLLHVYFLDVKLISTEETTTQATKEFPSFNNITATGIRKNHKRFNVTYTVPINRNHSTKVHQNLRMIRQILKYRKCCGPGQVSNISILEDMTELNCVNSSVESSPPRIHDRNSNIQVTPSNLSSFQVVYGIPACNSHLMTLPNERFRFSHHISTKGDLFFSDAVNLYASLDDYCIEHVEGEENQDYYVRYCLHRLNRQDVCKHSLCIPLCYGSKQALSGEPLPVKWNIPFYNRKHLVSDHVHYESYVGHPTCTHLPGSYNHLETPDHELYVQRNGDLISKSFGNEIHFGPEEYCLGMNFATHEMVAVVCFPEVNLNEPVKVMYYVKTACMTLSSLFLALAIALLVLLPVQKKKNKKILFTLKEIVNLCHCSTLFLFYTFLVITQLTHLFPVTPGACIFFGVAANYFFLSAFFWLNVMCFHMWYCIRSGMRPSSETETKKLIVFCVYAFFIPFVFIFVGLTIQFTSSSSHNLISPRYGDGTCFLTDDEKPYWTYLYGPVAVILVMNTVFFISTAVKLYHHSKACAKDNIENQYTFCLYLRLYLVMGVTWVMELASWQITTVHSWGDPEGWYLTDLINALQGVTVFLVFVLSSSGKRREIIKFVRTSRIGRYMSSVKTTNPLYQIKFFNQPEPSGTTEIDRLPNETQNEDKWGTRTCQTVSRVDINATEKTDSEVQTAVKDS